MKLLFPFNRQKIKRFSVKGKTTRSQITATYQTINKIESLLKVIIMNTMTSSILVISFMLILSTVNTINAQSFECPDQSANAEQEKTSSMIIITEEDYPCFQSIECLKTNQKFRNIAFSEDIQFPDEYVMSGEVTNMYLNARYDRRGNLIESTLYRKNTALPSSVRRQLVQDGLAGWTMMENEMVVNDFEAQKTEYKIVLEKDDNRQTLYFDNEGNRIQQLARR